MTDTRVSHPAVYPDEILNLMDEWLTPTGLVLDPFAGIGRIHTLNTETRHTVGIEIEPEWAEASEFTYLGDARVVLRHWDSSVFAAIATSPAYGNRMADQYDGRDGSKRRTYRTALGRELSAGSGAALQWGKEYRELHRDVWRECVRVLAPGGQFILNCKDHVRKGKVVPVTDWHWSTLTAMGLSTHQAKMIPLRGYGYGANANARVPYEWLIEMRKPE